jgi:hypothetical protein
MLDRVIVGSGMVLLVPKDGRACLFATYRLKSILPLVDFIYRYSVPVEKEDEPFFRRQSRTL